MSLYFLPEIALLEKVTMTVADGVKLGARVVIRHAELVSPYRCGIGSEIKIGTSVEIEKNAAIGRPLQDLMAQLHL